MQSSAAVSIEKQIRTRRNRRKLLVTDAKQLIQSARQILKYPIYSKLTFKVSLDFERMIRGRVPWREERALLLLLLRIGVRVTARRGYDWILINKQCHHNADVVKISVVFSDQLSVLERMCPGRLFLHSDQIGELTVSGLNGLESWNLNIQSEGVVCMKAARVMYCSSAACCKAYVALSLRCLSGQGFATACDIQPKIQGLHGISSNHWFIRKDKINSCWDFGGRDLKYRWGEITAVWIYICQI